MLLLTLLITVGTLQPQMLTGEKLAQAGNFGTEAAVVSVGDGDTLRVKRDEQAITIRLACVDAPETTQAPWGTKSASRLKQLLPVGQTVQVREVTRDRYGRTVGELFVEGQSINLIMVAEGQAAVYRDYLSACPNTRNQYLAAEFQAKAQRLGFWDQDNPEMPWDYRKRVENEKTNSTSIPAGATNSPATSCSFSYPDVCIPLPPPDLNCKNISYRRFRVLSPDPHGFDNDKNGLGCEF